MVCRFFGEFRGRRGECQGRSEAKGRGSVSERVQESARKDQRRLQISYFNESFRKERERESGVPFCSLACSVSCFLESCLIRLFIILCVLCSNVI